MSHYTPDVLVDVHPKTQGAYRTEEVPERVTPGLRLCRALIENAFADACRTRDGVPTKIALEASEWLTTSVNWTKMPNRPVPPQELRQLYPLSFSWCVQWLGLDEHEIREHGLPRQSYRAMPFKSATHAQKTRPTIAGKKHSHRHIAGLEEVREVWRRAAEEWNSKHTSDVFGLTATARLREDVSVCV